MRRLRLEAFDAILRQEVAYFDASSTGEITSRLTADITEMAADLTSVFRQVLEAVVRIAWIVAYMLLSSWRLGLVACAVVPLTAAVSRVYGRWLHDNAVRVQCALAEANSAATEAVSSIRTVLSFAAERAEAARFAAAVENHHWLNVRQLVINGLYYAVASTFLGNTCVAVALLAYGARLVTSGLMTPATLLGFMLYQAQLQEYWNNLVNAFTSLVRSSGAGAKVFALLDRQPQCQRPVGGGGDDGCEPHTPSAQTTGIGGAFDSCAGSRGEGKAWRRCRKSSLVTPGYSKCIRFVG